MTRAFQFRKGDKVKFILFEQEMSGLVVLVHGDILHVQLQEDPSVQHQIFASRVNEVTRGGAIHFLKNQE